MNKRLLPILSLFILFLGYRSDAQQTIATIRLAPVYNGPGATQDKKAAQLASALKSINKNIQKIIKADSTQPLQTILGELADIQRQLTDTVFKDSSHISNITAKARTISSARLPLIGKGRPPIDTIAWVFSQVIDTAKSINKLINSFRSNGNAVLLAQMAQSLKTNPQVLGIPGAASLNQQVSSILKTPSGNTLSNIVLAEITIDSVTIVTDTSKPAPPDANNTKCVKIDSIVSFKVDKEADGSYTFAFLNSQKNPVAKFSMTDLQKPAFWDQMAKALFGLCTASLTKADSAAGDSVIARLQQQDMYTNILQDINKANNSQDLAGKLTITKYVSVSHKFNPSTPPAPKPGDSPKAKTGNPAVASVQLLLMNVMQETIFGPANKKKNPGRSDTSETFPFTVYSIQIHFQDGFIENIKVLGKIQGNPRTLEFENSMPIAFSTKREFSQFGNTYLYEMTVFKGQHYSIKLGDVIFYSENYAVNNKDFCPQNQVYTNNVVTDSLTEVNLYKEQTAQILEAKVYTDLKGLNGDNPNGLVQLELSKKLNLWSHRSAIGERLNYGLFNYITPLFSLNKIENNQKYLTLNSNDTLASVNNHAAALTYASTVQLLNHQQFKVGFDLSVFLLDIPGIKSDFTVGATAYFGSTPVQDTLRVDTATGGREAFIPASSNNVLTYDANSFEWGPYISWQIFPSPCFGVVATYGLFSFKSLNNRFKQVRDSANFVNFLNSHQRIQYSLYERKQTFASWVNSIEIFAFYAPTSSSQLFFRYRLYKDMNYAKENFRQLQLGVTTYLTSTKQSKDAKASTAASTL